MKQKQFKPYGKPIKINHETEESIFGNKIPCLVVKIDGVPTIANGHIDENGELAINEARG